ncbi:MAG TPA: MFS transporter [Euzebya sp.]|nr:MFS transporter [Euzebya sp.]
MSRNPSPTTPSTEGEVRRTLAAVIIARLGINASQRVVYPFLPAIARGLDTSLSTVANLTALTSIVGLLAPLASLLSARVGRRAVMLGALAATLLGTVVLGLAGSVVIAGLGFALIGLGKPGFDVPMQAWFGDRVPYARRGRVLGATELTWAGGLLASVPISGWLISRTSWRSQFAVVAVLIVIGLVAVIALMPSDRPAQPTRAARPALTRPQRSVLAVILLFSFAAQGLFVVYGAWLETDLRLDVTAIGLFTLVVVVSELAGEGAVTAFGDRVGLRRSVRGALLGLVVIYAMLGVVGGSLAGAVVVVVGWFVCYEVTIVSSIPLVTELGGAGRDRLMGLMVVVVAIARAAAALVMPAVFAAGGIAAAGLLAAGCVMVGAVLLTMLVPDPAESAG